MIFLFKCDFFIPGKKFVEESDKFLGSALRRQRGETADIGEQNAHARMRLDEHLLEYQIELAVRQRTVVVVVVVEDGGFLGDVGQHGVGERSGQDGEQKAFESLVFPLRRHPVADETTRFGEIHPLPFVYRNPDAEADHVRRRVDDQGKEQSARPERRK